MAGLEGDFGAHSLRSGFVTEAGRQRVSLPAVMAMTEHRSVASVIGYFQAGTAEDDPAARLLGGLGTCTTRGASPRRLPLPATWQLQLPVHTNGRWNILRDVFQYIPT